MSPLVVIVPFHYISKLMFHVSFGADFNTKLMQILNGGNLKQIVY
jgi:hypothetical protein